MSNIRQESISGVKWQLISRLTMQPVVFVFGIVLARLISPAEMGILGLTSIFFAIATQLKDCGFGAALIRKQDRTEEDINTVFWFNIAMSLVMCMALCLAAPWFAEFFNCPPLVELTYVSAVMLFLNSTATVHWTLYSARRDFKTPAIVSTLTAILPMPLTIWAAFSGWSYWAMMLQGVVSGLLSLITIWMISPWKPRFIFSRTSFHEFFSFGSKLLATGLINISYGESRNLIIGKFYSPSQLAFFHRGFNLCMMPLSIIQSTVGSVSFPILSSIADDEQRLISTYRKYFRLTLMIVFFCMFSLAVNSPSFVNLLYGEMWLPCVLYAQLLSIGTMSNPTIALISSFLMVKGESGILLRAETFARVLGITMLILAAFHSVEAVCIAAVLTGTSHLLYMIIVVARRGWVSIREQLKDIIPYALVALVANIPAIILNQLYTPSSWLLAVGGGGACLIFLLIMQTRYDSTWALLMDLLEEKKILKYIPFLSRR